MFVVVELLTFIYCFKVYLNCHLVQTNRLAKIGPLLSCFVHVVVVKKMKLLLLENLLP